MGVWSNWWERKWPHRIKLEVGRSYPTTGGAGLTPPRINMTMENPPFEDVFTTEKWGFSNVMLVFRGVGPRSKKLSVVLKFPFHGFMCGIISREHRAWIYDLESRLHHNSDIGLSWPRKLIASKVGSGDRHLLSHYKACFGSNLFKIPEWMVVLGSKQVSLKMIQLF